MKTHPPNRAAHLVENYFQRGFRTVVLNLLLLILIIVPAVIVTKARAEDCPPDSTNGGQRLQVWLTVQATGQQLADGAFVAPYTPLVLHAKATALGHCTPMLADCSSSPCSCTPLQTYERTVNKITALAERDCTMKKTLLLKSELTNELIERQPVITVTLTRDDVLDLCLSLCLLRDDLISELVLRSKQMELYLEQRIEDKENWLVRSTHLVRVQLTAIELERIAVFFLRYYRDGVAQVDHLDIEAKEDVPGHLDGYVTFVVPDYLPPISSEEAKRKLGVE